MSEPPPQLDSSELQEWQKTLELANYCNILCHCRTCDREWIASTNETCSCGSTNVEHVACWQFPDD